MHLAGTADTPDNSIVLRPAKARGPQYDKKKGTARAVAFMPSVFSVILRLCGEDRADEGVRPTRALFVPGPIDIRGRSEGWVAMRVTFPAPREHAAKKPKPRDLLGAFKY